MKIEVIKSEDISKNHQKGGSTPNPLTPSPPTEAQDLLGLGTFAGADGVKL